MKHAVVWIITLIYFIMLLGDFAMGEEIVSVEQLIAMAGLENETIDGNAVQEIIKRYSITMEKAMGVGQKELHDGLRDILQTDYKNKYDYLFEYPTVIRPDHDLSAEEIKLVAVYHNLELVNETALIDFSNGIAYTDPVRLFFKDISDAEGICQIDEAKKDEIMKILARGDWLQWENNYREESNHEMIGSIGYGIVIETDKGIIRSAVTGWNDQIPDELFDIVFDILSASFSWTEEEKSMKTKEFVARCYRYALEREGAEEELSYWTALVTNEGKTVADIANGILSSEEFQNHGLGNEETVKVLYRIYFDREPDNRGLNHWTDMLNNGVALLTVEEELAESEEFRLMMSIPISKTAVETTNEAIIEQPTPEPTPEPTAEPTPKPTAEPTPKPDEEDKSGIMVYQYDVDNGYVLSEWTVNVSVGMNVIDAGITPEGYELVGPSKKVVSVDENGNPSENPVFWGYVKSDHE